MYIKNIDNETLMFLYLDLFIFVHPIDLVNCQSCLTVYIFLNILIPLSNSSKNDICSETTVAN